MTSVKVKFTPSSVILKEGTVHYQIIHHCKVRHIRQEVEKAEKAILSH